MSQKIGFAGTVLMAAALIATILATPAKHPVGLSGPYCGAMDDIQYYPLIHENKLAKETVALKAARTAAKEAAQLARAKAEQAVAGPTAYFCGYDEIQPYPAGQENKLAHETEALKAARAAAKAAQQVR